MNLLSLTTILFPVVFPVCGWCWQHPTITIKEHHTLQKTRGDITQIAPLGDGRIVVLDASFENRPLQTIEIYSNTGSLIGQVGRYGVNKGEYSALASIATSKDGSIWSAEFSRRVMKFSAAGDIEKANVLRKPSYVHHMVLDEPRNTLLISGWFFPGTGNNDHVALLHRYQAQTIELKDSLLEEDPEASQRNLFTLEDVVIDVDSIGRVYAANAPLRKLWRVNLNTQRVETFSIGSKLMGVVPMLDSNPDTKLRSDQKARNENYLIDGLLYTNHLIVVSAAKPHNGGTLLQIFDEAGEQVGTDIDAPGQLVGKTYAGELYFVKKLKNGFDLATCTVAKGGSLQPPKSRGSR